MARIQRVICMVLALGTGDLSWSRASEALTVDVRVTIASVQAIDEVDEPDGDADFFAKVTIGGQSFQTDPCAFEDNEHIFPDWEFKKEGVDINQGPVPIQIQIWDDDDPCPGAFDIGTDDELVDVSPDPDRTLDLTLSLAPCSFGGDLSGSCNTLVASEGNDDTDDYGRIAFKIEVDFPPSAPGLNVRCWHTPIWPQPGQTVSIRAEALDGNLQPTVIADDIGIFLGSNQSVPAASTAGLGELTFVTSPVGTPSFSYACRVTAGGTPVWTGWRTAAVGPPLMTGGPVPIMYTGPSTSRVDVVFIADKDSYTGAQAQPFLDDVSAVMQQAYFAVGDTTADAAILLTNQDTFNFWLATATGDAQEVTATSCPHVAPPTWPNLYPFADAGAILHTANFRDCAVPAVRLFSSEPTSIRTIRHEQGHQPFGLADEYCNMRPGSASTVCDGGYFQADPFPNVYAGGDACEADAPNLGNGACQSWVARTRTWETSEPVNGDLMVDNTTPRAADVRRIDWMLNTRCSGAGC